MLFPLNKIVAASRIKGTLLVKMSEYSYFLSTLWDFLAYAEKCKCDSSNRRQLDFGRSYDGILLLIERVCFPYSERFLAQIFYFCTEHYLTRPNGRHCSLLVGVRKCFHSNSQMLPPK